MEKTPAETDRATSQAILSLYNKQAEDETFELQDKPGINIIKKYKSGSPLAEKNYRMFISFYIKEDNTVAGSVDTVKAKEQSDYGGYSIVFDDQKSGENFGGRKYINFLFGYDGEAIFDQKDKKIMLAGHNLTINGFVDVLVKNHIGGIFKDMFRRDRTLILLKNFFILEPSFWLIDDDYKKNRIEFLLDERTTGRKEKERLVEMPKDPFFKYFCLFKNTLLISILWFLIPIFWLSILLDTDYFTISNPFLLFTAILVFAILEKIDQKLFISIRENKDSFIHKTAKSTLNMKGKLKL
jgi:hypothetical protein